ncbi:MAG TPA: DUF2269 family protein [Ktedonobacterales bacterium]|nr:DUF2269 family protein [Ktedonobacterales bacterium]
MYQWIVFVHILGIFGFLLAHGAAAAVAFKLRAERDETRIRALLDLSRSVSMVSSVALLTLLAAGVALGFMGQWWGQGWIWISLGLFLLIGVAMMALASRPFNRVRQLLQMEQVKASATASVKLQGAALEKQVAVTLGATHPLLLTLLSGIGLALILWLMMFKPF